MNVVPSVRPNSDYLRVRSEFKNASTSGDARVKATQNEVMTYQASLRYSTGLNLAHAFFAIQAIAPGMIAAGQGSIVNFGSISWMAAQAGVPVYTAAKAVTHGTTRRRSHLPPLLRTSLLETEGGPMAERITQACAKPLILVQLQVGPPFPEGRRRRSLRAAAGQSAGDRH